jgi:hypothetical protein
MRSFFVIFMNEPVSPSPFLFFLIYTHSARVIFLWLFNYSTHSNQGVEIRNVS